MKKVLACCLVLCFGVAANAGDVIQIGPGEPVDGVPFATNDDICGVLDFDGVNGLANQRRGDGVESFDLVPCEGDGLKEISWYAADNTDGDFNTDSGDYATDTADNVEGSNYCGDFEEVGVSREPLLDDSGNQVVLFGRNCWIYSAEVGGAALGYVTARPLLGGGQSFVLTRPCNGEGQGYFQSFTFGFDCSVPNEDVFGSPFCAAMVARSGTPRNFCVYTVTSVKRKKGPCGDRCEACPLNDGDLVCAGECDSSRDCKNKLAGFLPCAGGGICKVKATDPECVPCPRGAFRCR